MRLERGFWLTGAAVLGFVAGGGVAVAESPALVATTEQFVFHTDFDTNLNDALIQAGLARSRGRAEKFPGDRERACFDALPDATRKGWELAVDYYAEIVSPVEWTGREQYLLRLAFSGAEPIDREQDLEYVSIVRGVLAAASPAYRACRWPAQDAENRAWVAALTPLLDAYGKAVAEKLAAAYHQPLSGLPMRVDVVETVNWSGANTILLDEGGGHILISKADPGPLSLELVFHEASHTLMGRNAPVRDALARAAEETGVELPRDLWHGVLFYMTGDAVRRVLVESGAPPYTPMMQAQKIFEKYIAPLEGVWPAYMDGKRSLDEASRDLLPALGAAKADGG